MQCRYPLQLLFVAMFALVVSPVLAAEKEDDAGTKSATIARFVVKGSYPESQQQAGLFAELEETLPKLIERIEKAGKDDDIKAIVLEIENPSLGVGKINEVRHALDRYRESGKKAYAHLGLAMTPDYLLALSCDEVVMPPSGTLAVPGLRAEFTFLKNLLDKLGVKADFEQMGKYKGAAESYTRDSLSEASREQWQALLDDMYEDVVKRIADSRQIKPAKVKQLLDEGLFTASRAEELGLIDRVAYHDGLHDAIEKDLGVDELEVNEKFGKKKIDTDFSGFSGMLKLMDLMMNGDKAGRSSKKPKIAVIYAVGAIVTGDGEAGLMGGESVGDRPTVKALQKAAKDESVKAIVLRVDSPGGSALASDLIWREIVQIDKPVIASMGNVAASGGYYISMGADKIYAEPDTLTGSIGVIGGKIALDGLYGKLGVTTEVLSRGKNSGLFSMNQPFSNSERQAWVRMMQETYDQFLDKAAEGRGMEREKLVELAGGRVWTGRMAVENGLVDELGTLHDAIAEAKQQAGLDKDEEVELMTLPKPKSFFEQLFGDDASEVRLDVSAAAPREVSALVKQARLFSELFREPTLLMLPYRVELK